MAHRNPTCWQAVGMAAIGVAAVLASPLLASQYYFSSLGNDQIGDGTQLNPWRTISKFNSLDLNPGDNVFFRAGEIFNGSLLLDATDTGTDIHGELIAPISISSYGGGPTDRAIIRSPPTATALLAYNTGGIELKNLEFSNGGTHFSNSASGIQFSLDQTASAGLTHFRHIRIDNVISRGFHRSGLSFQAAGSVGYQDIAVTSSEFYDNQFAGLEIAAAGWTDLIHRDVRIDGVTARNNPGFVGCEPHCGHGIVLGQVEGAVVQNSVAHSNGVVAGKGNVGIWTWQSSNVTIERNSSYGNRSPNGGDGGGFDIDGGVTNSVVQYNTSHDNDGAGYLLAQFAFAEPMQQNVFRYNLSANDGVDEYGAFTIWGQDPTSFASSTVFHNNTAIVDGNVAPSSRGTVWFINSNHNDIDLLNNLFVALNGAALIDGTTSLDQSRFVNNAYWTDGAPIRIGDTVFGSIAEWAAASQQEMLNGQFVGVEADPHFGTGGDYKPMPPSLLIDAGLAADSTAWPPWLTGPGPADLHGVSLPQGMGVDIGAAEFAVLRGDYNGDGNVDAADYVVWRKSLGQTGAGLAADGNLDGTIDSEDYGIWRVNFGRSRGSGAIFARAPMAAANVPEPATVSLLVLVCFLPGLVRSIRRVGSKSPNQGPGAANRRAGVFHEN